MVVAYSFEDLYSTNYEVCMANIHSYTLKNGLHILTYPDKKASKVSMQLWYGVGSKDERSGERGLAHLLEHMIFKGTGRLSESDINLITHKLSGYTNAFTSYDFTGYMFDFPKRHWESALDLLADCMVNCTFKKDLLNAELKAVIQELKMYKDDYVTSLTEEMISLIFKEHPYHYPIIGYKQDLCAITQEGLLAFYKKHYVPNNASLVVVGDVKPDDVYRRADQYFGKLKADAGYKKATYLLQDDIKQVGIQLYRDVEQPILLLAWQIPGMKDGKHFYFEVLRWLIAQGHGSRLYKKLVNETQVAAHIDGFTDDLFDQGLFFVRIYPKEVGLFDEIMGTIAREIDRMQQDFFEDAEIKRAMNQVRMQHVSLLEDTSELAYAIGQSWLSLGNADYITSYLDHSMRDVRDALQQFLPLFSVARMHRGSVAPIQEDDRRYWEAAQKESDALDEKVLSQKERTSKIEPGVYVNTVQAKEPSLPPVVVYEEVKTARGLTLLTHFNDRVDKVDIVLNMRAKSAYDPENLSGLCNFVYLLLQEGTQRYPGLSFMQELEALGMNLDIAPGLITLSVLKKDLEKGFELLLELLQAPLFEKRAIEKVRAQLFSELSEFWDTPSDFISCIAESRVYKNHPFAKHYLGSRDTVARITQSAIKNFWDTYGSPDGAYLAIAGPVDQKTVLALFDKTIARWDGPLVKELEYPVLAPLKKEVVNYPINRDQVVLCFAGLSVNRMHKDYEALHLFDQIVTGGMLGSMSSRLFQLREQTGLFYTIGGSVVLNASHEPGMVMIKTIVSLDRLAEAEQMIKHTLTVTPETLEEKEVTEAKHAIVSGLHDAFSTNISSVYTMIFLARYGLGPSYIQQQASMIQGIEKIDIQNAAQKILDENQLITIRAGRLEV